MKVVLYVATSVNGLITRGRDDSDWVTDTDWEEFDALMKDCGIMVMGRRTYEIFGDDFPCEGAINIVMTKKPKLHKMFSKDAVFTNKSPKEVIKMASDKGFKQLMLIGGEKLNSSFFKDDLIDEIILSIHPLLFGKGKLIIRNVAYDKKLKLLGVKKLKDDLVQLHYTIEK